MSSIYLVLYVALGIVTAIATMCVFPPMEGFKPRLILRVLAIGVFTLLWPILVALAAWYLSVGYLNRSKRTRSGSSVQNVDLVRVEPLSGFQGSKPR